MFILQVGVDITISSKIAECSKSHDAWETLEKAYKGSVKVKVVKLQMLIRDFETLTMKLNRGGRGHGRVKGRGGCGRERHNNPGRGNFHCNYCNKDGQLESYCFKK
jgi:hypothetical protein